MCYFTQSITFGLHMQTCMIIIAVTTALWLFWAISGLLYSNYYIANNNNKKKLNNSDNNNYNNNNNNNANKGNLNRTTVYWYCLLLQLWLVLSSMLEVFDFPPYLYLFDAHSLWHLATVPLGFMWYHFWSIFDGTNNCNEHFHVDDDNDKDGDDKDSAIVRIDSKQD